MGNITTELENIKKAVYGNEVRDSIHDAIKTCYDDAAVAGNANMEVALARGEYSTLNDRLKNNDNKFAEVNEQFNTIENNVNIFYLQLKTGDYDNGLIINNAIKQNTNYTKFKIPSGEYVIKTPIIIDKIGLELFGDGQSSTVLINGTNSYCIELNGIGCPAIRTNFNLHDFSITSSSVNDNSCGIKSIDSADFILKRLIISKQGVGILSQSSLLYSVTDCKLEKNNIGIFFDSETITPNGIKCANAISIKSCKIIGNNKQAIKSIGDSNLIAFENCEIEENGTFDSGLNICHFEKFNKIGSYQPISFISCWFENNIGNSDLYAKPNVALAGGISIINSSFISTEVKNNIICENSIVNIISSSANSNVSDVNLLLNNCSGFVICLFKSKNVTGTVNLFAIDESKYKSDVAIATGNCLKIHYDNDNSMKFTTTINGGLQISNINDLELGQAFVKGGSYLFSKREIASQVPTLRPLSLFVNTDGRLCFLDSEGRQWFISMTLE